MNRIGYDAALQRIADGRWIVDPKTGVVGNHRGAPFRYVMPNGYVRISLRVGPMVTPVLAHRVVWESVHGPIRDSTLEIDHVNGDRSDNRLVNLRLVTHARNIQLAREAARVA